jgi:hypothetical protein
VRKPLFWTTNPVKARESRFVWLDHGNGQFSLSLLGIINGLLPTDWLLVKRETL